MDQQNTVAPKYMDSVNNFIEGRDFDFETLKNTLNQATSDELIAIRDLLTLQFLSFPRTATIQNDRNDGMRITEDGRVVPRRWQSIESINSVNDVISMRKKDIRYLLVLNFLINNEKLKNSLKSMLKIILEKEKNIFTDIKSRVDDRLLEYYVKGNDDDVDDNVNVDDNGHEIYESDNIFLKKSVDNIKKVDDIIALLESTSDEIAKDVEDKIKAHVEDMYKFFEKKNAYFGQGRKEDFYKNYVSVNSEKIKTIFPVYQHYLKIYERFELELHLRVKYYRYNYGEDETVIYENENPIIGMFLLFQSILISKGMLTKQAHFPELEESVGIQLVKPTITSAQSVGSAVGSFKNRLGFGSNRQPGGKRKTKTKKQIKKQIKKTIKKSRKRR